MKKLAIGAIAAVFATLSLSTVADARPNWRHGWNHGGLHHGWNHRGWHGGWHHGWRHGGWHRGRWGWRGGYWGGPRLVIGVGPGPCYVKKVRHVDHGHVWVSRVRVCR